MTLTINCRFLTQDLTGVQRFAEEIALRLISLVDDVRLIAPKGEIRRTELGGKKVEQVGLLTGHLWEQIELPLYLSGRPGKLVSLGNTGPIVVKKQAVVIHDLTWLYAPESYSVRFRRFYSMVTRALTARVDTLCTVSNHSKRILEAHYGLKPGRVSVVSNAVDKGFVELSGTRPEMLNEGEYFLVVSSLNRHKNIAAFIDAFLEFTRDNDSFTKLVLVGGSSPSFSQIDRDMCKENEETNVQLLGRVTDSELVWLYSHAKAFVFPSRHEGFGIPPLEAQALGCPVAASSIPALRETLRSSALYFDPDSKESMVNALRELDRSQELREQLVSEGKSNASRFSWQRSAERVLYAMKLDG